MCLQSLGWEDPLEKETATHSRIFAWNIPWTGEPGGLQSMCLQRARHNWATEHTHMQEFYWVRCPWEKKERDPENLGAVRSQYRTDPCEREREGKRIGPVESQITGQFWECFSQVNREFSSQSCPSERSPLSYRKCVISLRVVSDSLWVYEL